MASQIDHVSNENELKTYLLIELDRRKKSNPYYSLRAFAKRLGVDASLLSKILKGKRPVTTKFADKVTSPLGINDEQVKFIKESIRLRKEKMRTKLKLVPQKFKQIDPRVIDLVNQWYYFSILELQTIKNFEFSAERIADVIDIPLSKAREALDALEALRLHCRAENNSTNFTTLGINYTTAQLKKVQKQHLLKAMRAIDKYSVDERDNATVTVAVDPDLIPEAKRRVKAFRRELAAFLQSNSGKGEQIFQFSTALYPVSKKLDGQSEDKDKKENQKCI